MDVDELAVSSQREVPGFQCEAPDNFHHPNPGTVPARVSSNGIPKAVVSTELPHSMVPSVEDNPPLQLSPTANIYCLQPAQLMTIRLQISGRDVVALIDSGASNNLVRKSVLNGIPAEKRVHIAIQGLGGQ